MRICRGEDPLMTLLFNSKSRLGLSWAGANTDYSDSARVSPEGRDPARRAMGELTAGILCGAIVFMGWNRTFQHQKPSKSDHGWC